MSSRDIDSTSENVLHDWAREDAAGDEQEPSTSSLRARRRDGGRRPGEARREPTSRGRRGRRRRDGGRGRAGRADATRRSSTRSAERGRAAIDETPMHVELSHEHAAGELHVPDGYAVLEGVADGRPARGRRSSSSRFNGEVTTQLLERRSPSSTTAGVRRGGDHGHARSRRVRAAARRDGAREDAALRVHRRARLRHPRRDAALRLRRRARRRAASSSPRSRPASRSRSASSRSIASSRRRRGSTRAPRPCAPRSRWPTSSRSFGQPLRVRRTLSRSGESAREASASGFRARRPTARSYTARPPCPRSAQSAGRSPASATTGATRWWPRSAASTRTSSASACCSTASDPRLRLHPLPQGRQGPESASSSLRWQ